MGTEPAPTSLGLCLEVPDPQDHTDHQGRGGGGVRVEQVGNKATASGSLLMPMANASSSTSLLLSSLGRTDVASGPLIPRGCAEGFLRGKKKKEKKKQLTGAGIFSHRGDT